MPLIDVKCPNDHIREVMRPLAMHPQTPVCPECGAATEQIFLPTRRRTCDPVVVYQAPDGSYRFPGDTDAASTGKYDRMGYTRIELRNAADVRRFESHMNKVEFSRSSRRAEAMQAAREQRESATRSELRRLMNGMSERGKAVARAAMSRNDSKPRERGKDCGFHVDVYSNSRSNREVSRDAQGRRRRD